LRRRARRRHSAHGTSACRSRVNRTLSLVAQSDGAYPRRRNASRTLTVDGRSCLGRPGRSWVLVVTQRAVSISTACGRCEGRLLLA
jgi:hypothetical protein